MKTYARISSGFVAELFSTEGDITAMFNASLVWVEVTAISPQPQIGWSAIASGREWSFAPPTGPTLAQAQTAQIAVLSAACGRAIASSFSSSALGSAATYPSSPTDQINQNTVAQCSAGGQLWCEVSGTWALKQHTQAQAQAVVSDFGVWLNKCQQQLVTLSGQINAATSVSAVQAIAWANPS